MFVILLTSLDIAVLCPSGAAWAGRGMVKMGWSTKYYSCGGPLQVAHTGTTLYFGSSRVKAHSGCLDYRLAGLTPADLIDHGQLLTAAHPGPGAY